MLPQMAKVSLFIFHGLYVSHVYPRVLECVSCVYPKNKKCVSRASVDTLYLQVWPTHHLRPVACTAGVTRAPLGARPGWGGEAQPV